MGGDNMQVKVARSGIYDMYRGVFLNRGVFVKAPPGFFSAYPSDFEQPPVGYEKLNLTLRVIPTWHPKTGILPPPVEQVEVPPPAPTTMPATPTVVAAATEPVAASDNAQHLPTTSEPSLAAQKQRPARGRSVKIR